ncbi:hypothetical protein GGR53DRAFT_462422 [Hypoxylon sp. FL1150]|nr:hypothetical protein GGR53DRAFT_462422 [Hypoxylon sp. FL1150]
MLKIYPYSAKKKPIPHRHNPFVLPREGSQTRDNNEDPRQSFHYFPKLPYEIRLQIWKLLLPPPRIICLRPLSAYVEFPREYPSVHIPQFYAACQDSRALATKSAVGLMFSDRGGTPIHCEWYDRRHDIFYIPSIGVLRLWNRRDTFLRGTVVVNLLEMVEDERRTVDAFKVIMRLVDPHPIFHHLKDVSTILLSMMTVQWAGDQWGSDLDIYGDNTTAFVDLDDPKLPDLLRPACANVRSLRWMEYWAMPLCYPCYPPVHMRPSCILKHLHRKWDDEFKARFEDQWLLAKLGLTRMIYQYCPSRRIPGLFTEELYSPMTPGMRMLNRKHRAVKPFLAGMPEIHPVIVFEKVYPSDTTDVIYDAGEDAVIDIFAIHGLGSKPDSSWIYNPNTTRIQWLSLIPQAEGLHDIKVVEANHRTRWDLNTVQMNFQDYASDLLDLIETQHKAHPDRPILFIAYSYSGLLLKKALLLAKSRATYVAAATRGIIFMAVPHRGTHDTFIASCLSCMSFFRSSSANMLEAMSFDNPTLIDLESEFYDAYVLQHHPHERQPYICDIVESQPKSVVPRHGRIVTIDTAHRGLEKFQSISDPNFQVLVNIIGAAMRYALPTDSTASQDNQVPDDILDYVSYGMPWAARGRKAALLLGGLEEFAASWIAGDPNKHGNHFTARCPKTMVYRGVVSASVSQGLAWIMRKAFEGHTSNAARFLQVFSSNIIIVPLQIAIDLLILALIAGARTPAHFHSTTRVGLRIYARLYCWIAPITFLVAYNFLPQETWSKLFGLASCLFYVAGNTMVKKRRLAALRKKRARSDSTRKTVQIAEVAETAEIVGSGAAEVDIPPIIDMRGEINEWIGNVEEEMVENNSIVILTEPEVTEATGGG